MTKRSNRLFFALSIFMGLTVIVSNYLVQFPVKHYGLRELLTYGAFTYPISFLITDLANRAFGKAIARRIVYIGFTIGVLLTLFVSTNFSDLISIRIAIGSGLAFLIAQNIDILLFDKLRKKIWFVAPLTSSVFGSIVDTFLFFSIAFYNSGISRVSLALGDLTIKLLMSLLMLIPFRLIINEIRDIGEEKSDQELYKF